ncbi:MAG: hypothetical protein P8J50_19850 [Acidimicrobiales bacterium]|jgi:hypothetical protein|nr:hypothetical protein [Acidimicrobiales bacterium]
MPIAGTHALIYSPEAEAVRDFFRDVLEYENIDAGGGWLIFALPPCDIGVHPSDGSTQHEFSFQCDDIESTMAELVEKGVEFPGPPIDHGYGPHTYIKLAGGV